MINESETPYTPTISRGYTCTLCGKEVPEGVFHDCQLPTSEAQQEGTVDAEKGIPGDKELCDFASRVSLNAAFNPESKPAEAVTDEQLQKELADLMFEEFPSDTLVTTQDCAYVAKKISKYIAGRKHSATQGEQGK